MRLSELITFHELTHQWFQSTIASNEQRYPFLDEGLTAYVEWVFFEKSRHSLVSWPGLSITRLTAGRYAHFRYNQVHSSHQPITPVVSAASDFISFAELASVIYSRTPLCLTTLARIYGEVQFDNALRSYAIKNRFAHPQPSDLLREIAAYSGIEAAEQARLMFESNGDLNLKLGAVKSSTHGESFSSKISVEHEGQLSLPYLILVTFSDHSSIRLKGNADASTKTTQFHHRLPIIAVELDPDYLILLDSNLLDNIAHSLNLFRYPKSPRRH